MTRCKDPSTLTWRMRIAEGLCPYLKMLDQALLPGSIVSGSSWNALAGGLLRRIATMKMKSSSSGVFAEEECSEWAQLLGIFRP